MKEGRGLEVVIAAGDQRVREELRRGTEAQKGAHIAALCASGDEVRTALRSRPIHLLILDVDLPAAGGFSLLRSLNGETPPAVIFTASSDEQALAAFQFHPLDYLLHPIDPQHLATALRRAAERFGGNPGHDDALDVLSPSGAHALQHRRLMVKSAGRILFLRAEEIDWIQADRDYVRIHNGARKHHLRGTISGMEQQLQDERFVRIHRSTIVNVDRIREMQPLSYGEYAVILHDGTRLTLSRSFRERVFSVLMTAA
jgi:two-component system LytT family response regulator